MIICRCHGIGSSPNEKIADTILTQVDNNVISADEAEEIAYRVGVQKELSDALLTSKDKVTIKGEKPYKGQWTQ